MANFARLHDLYSFPGFVPTATAHGLFGDPYAVVLTLRRRRKKLAAACAAPAIAPSTINPCARYATSIAAGGASTWRSPSDASFVATAKL
jgi:hypothetical protein